MTEKRKILEPKLLKLNFKGDYMALSERENYLRNARMMGPEWIPCTVSISDASRNQLGNELEEVILRHPLLFPDFKKGESNYENLEFGPAHKANERFTDAWGCVWLSSINGLEGQVVESPLDKWEKLKDYQVPDPLRQADRGPASWELTQREIKKAKKQGRLTTGSLPHGFFLMRLWYLRGFENLMLDFATNAPELPELIDMVTVHNKKIVDQWLTMGVDLINFGEDLGTQTASIISPRDFRKWVVPVYKKLMEPCREANCLIALHSDGYIMELMDDFIDCGVNIINPQDLCNGIDNLVRDVKGRMCIRLDIDRQTIVPFGTRKEIRELIEEEVRKLGSPQGGLEIIAGIYPPTPPENIDALCEALEEFRIYWWDGRGK